MTRPSWIGYTLGGRYKIESLLGQGGMSAVYKGTDPNLRRTVAVKLVHAHLASDPQFVRRFEEEAAAVAQLRHPNIIQVYDFNHDGDTYYMVLEYLEGETLGEHLQQVPGDTGMSQQEVLSIMNKLCAAVDYAHQNGIIHRDLKPANVMIRPDGEPILMDFGIVKMLQSNQHTATGMVLGTMAYMSPEQIRGEKVDHRTDIYALGVMLFEMLSGRKPFEGESTVTTMMMHLNDPPPQLSSLNPAIPKAVCDVVSMSLAKQASDRYQTASELARALADAYRGKGPAVPLDPHQTMLPPSDATAVMAAPPATGMRLSDTTVQPAQPLSQPTQVAPTGGWESAPPLPDPTSVPGSQSPASNRLLQIGGAVLAVIAIAIIGYFVFGGAGGGGQNDGAIEVPPLSGDATEDGAAIAAATETATPTESIPTATTEPSPTPDLDATATVEQAAFLAADDDDDGLTNEQELEIGTSLTSADTDNDGMTDLNENAVICLDPLDDDTDDDGIIDNEDPDPCSGGTPEATATPDKIARITNISLDNGSYIVDFETIGYAPAPGDFHVHFYFNNITEENAGVPGTGPWEVYAAESPFNRFAQANKPADADMMCIAVAQPTHMIQLGGGNCFTLPTERTVEPTATPVPAPTDPPVPTATAVPAPTATPVPAPTDPPAETGKSTRITNISISDGAYIIDFTTTGFAPAPNDFHVHFFFDTVSVENAGVPGGGPWKLYTAGSPFTQYTVAERPGGASSMCILVANPDHSIQPGTGNCVALP